MSSDPTHVRRLSIRTGADGESTVHCARRGVDVDVASCQSCGHCIGLSARDSYLVCSWQERDATSAEGHAQPMKTAQHSTSPTLATLSLGLGRFERRVITANLDDTVFDVANLMRTERVGCVVVIRDGRPVGILTDRDIVLRVVAEGLDPRREQVAGIVTYDAATVLRTDGFETAVRIMREHGVRRLPIIDADGRVTGIVTADDLVALLGRELSALGEAITGNVDGSESR